MSADTADAVIIGGGVIGASTLYNLASRGVTDTVLLEQDLLGSGSTSRSQAILRMHYSNEVTARLAWESLRLFKEFEDLTGTPAGFVKTGYFLAVKRDQDGDSLRANVAMLRQLGITTEVVEPGDVSSIAPVFAAREDELFAYEPESGFADPYSVTTGFARKARELGAQVRTGVAATDVEVVGGRVRAVVTAGGRVETTVAVVAAGPWSKPLLGKLGLDVPLSTIRHQVVMIRRPEDEVPDHPIIGDVANDFSARPDTASMTLAGVGEDEAPGPDDYNQGVDMSTVQETMASLAVRIPGMSAGVFRGGWSGLFTATPDWHPILGAVDGIEGLYMAVGFSGHGFKLSPMIGVAMAEIITQGQSSTVDVSMLDFARFAENRPMDSRYRMKVLA